MTTMIHLKSAKVRVVKSEPSNETSVPPLETTKITLGFKIGVEWRNKAHVRLHHEQRAMFEFICNWTEAGLLKKGVDEDCDRHLRRLYRTNTANKGQSYI